MSASGTRSGRRRIALVVGTGTSSIDAVPVPATKISISDLVLSGDDPDARTRATETVRFGSPELDLN